MPFYIGIVLITTLLAWIYEYSKDKITKKVLFAVLVLFPSTLSGLRGVGTDIFHYIWYDNEIINGTYELVDYKSIFVQITRLLLELNVPFQLILFAVSVITIYIVFKVFSSFERNISFTFAVFSYMLIFYQMSFNTYRQIMAAAFFLLATIALFKEENKKNFILLWIISVLIHSSLLPFGLIYFFEDLITSKKYRKTRVLIYMLGTIFIFLIPYTTNRMDDLLSIIPHYGWYITRFSQREIGFGIMRFFVMAIVPLIFIIKKDIDKDLTDKKMSFLPFYISMGFILWLTSYISDSSLYRVSFNMLIALPLFHGYFFSKLIKSRIIIQLAITGIMVLFWYYDGAIINTGETVPYRFYWEI